MKEIINEIASSCEPCSDSNNVPDGLKPFVLSEWVKDKSRKVVTKTGEEVKVAFVPMFMMDNGELAGTYNGFTKSGLRGPICETPSNLFFAD